MLFVRKIAIDTREATRAARPGSPAASRLLRVASAAMSAKLLRSVTSLLIVSCLFCFDAQATRPPESLKETLKQVFPSARVRLDGVIEQSNALFVPLIPKSADAKTLAVPGLLGKYPQDNPTLFAFKNGWYYLKLVDKDGKKLLFLPAETPEAERQKIAKCSLPSDLIVPTGMYVSKELQASIGEVNVEVLDPAKPQQTQAASAQKPAAASTAGNGIVAVTSPQTGKIALLGNSLEKISELPTDGTPGGMTFVGGKLYVADQTKNRVLIVDPQKREFAGQINFPAGSGPKGVTSVADGAFLYVSECASNKVAVVELATGKVLLHCGVAAGPTRIKLTPNSYTLVVLNVPAAKVTFISTLTNKVIGIVPVGHMPSDVAISSDSKTAYVTNRLSNTISVIDITQRRYLGTLATGEGPTGIELSKDGQRLFVANAKENTIGVYDLKTMTKVKDVTLPIDVEFPSDIMLLPDGNRLMVTSAATDTLGIMNVETLEFEKQPALGCTSVDLIYIPQ